MILNLRNGMNHIILHLLLKYRYRARRRPRMIKCIVAAEMLCVKAGLIYYGRDHA